MNDISDTGADGDGGEGVWLEVRPFLEFYVDGADVEAARGAVLYSTAVPEDVEGARVLGDLIGDDAAAEGDLAETLRRPRR